MYISSALSHQYNNQLYFNRKNYTSFKQDTDIKAESRQEQAKKRKNKNIHTAF